MKSRNFTLFFSFTNLQFDLSAMGFNKYIPQFLLFGIFMFAFLLHLTGRFEYKYLCNSLELLTSIGGLWFCLFFMRQIFELGGELFFTYDVSRFYLGSLRLLRIYLVYTLEIIVILLAFFFILHLPFKDIISLFLLTSAQTFFIFSFGYISMVVTKDMFYAMAVSFAYIIFFSFTQGKILNNFCVFLFSDIPLSFDKLLGELLRIDIYSTVFFISSQVLFNRMSPLSMRVEE